MTEKSEHRQALETRAEEMGVKFAHNIGDETLAERIAAAEAEAEGQDTPPSPTAGGDQAGADPQASPSVPGLVVRVTGPKKGRWRAGRHFTAEPVDIPMDELTGDELAALEADPKIEIEPIDTGED